MFPSLYVVGFIAIALAMLLLGFMLPTRRAKRVENVAGELNFRFSATAWPFEGTDIHGLEILENGPSTVVNNLLERTSGRCRFLIFDIDSFPLEGTTTTVTTTVAAFHLPDTYLPVFQIGEKNSFERVLEQIEHAFGKKLDQFDDDHEFTRNFFVHSPVKGKVRDFLTPVKLTYLRGHASHLQFASSSEWLLIYREGVRVEPEDLKHFSEITSAMASVLLSIQLPKAA